MASRIWWAFSFVVSISNNRNVTSGAVFRQEEVMILPSTTSQSFSGTAPDSSGSFLLQPPHRRQVIAFLPFRTPLFDIGKTATQTDAINHRYQFPHHSRNHHAPSQLHQQKGWTPWFQKHSGIKVKFSYVTFRGRVPFYLPEKLLFIPASNEPSSHACMDIWRLPRGSNTPLLCREVFDLFRRFYGICIFITD